MRIGFDLRPFLREETGVGIYFKKLLFSMAKIDRKDEFFLFSSSWKDRFDPKKVPSFAKMAFLDLRYPVKVVNFFWSRLGWPSLDSFFKTKLDLTHSPTPLPLPTGGKQVITVYDLFFLEFPDLTNHQARRNFSRGIEQSVKNADGIVTISRFTEEQLIQRFFVDRDKIRVIHPGIDLDHWVQSEPQEMERIKTKFELPSEFLLFVGTFEPRKNLRNLLKALKIVHERFGKIPLILVGRKGLDSDNIKKDIGTLTLDSWVKMVGYVDETELRDIYRLASVFVFPSLWEGFGIPLLEAMASGLPIVTSRTSALPEIAQDAALYTDPEDPDDLATKIIQVLEGSDVKKKLISNGKERVRAFSWERAASETLTFYKNIFQRS
ncbi:MAG: glycosyltransferase family 4 protein [Candidatus Aminicenantes bacterium]|nr:MAG: glycosyltransferase family 4 protein [Candidatus Aminicenantes bacterium]